MDYVVKVRQCEWCHEPFHLHDGRYRYCSDECAEAARLARRGKNLKESAVTLSPAAKRFLEAYLKRRLQKLSQTSKRKKKHPNRIRRRTRGRRANR